MASIFDLYRSVFGGGAEPPRAAPQNYDVGPDTIPLSLDRTEVNDPYTGTALQQLMGRLGDIGTAIPGLVERAQLGGMNALGMRQADGDIYRSRLPVAPGIEALGDVANFATGGLQSGLFPAAGAIRQGLPYAKPAALDTLRALDEALPTYDPNTLGAFGSGRMTPAMRRRQAITLDTPLESVPEDSIPTPLVRNVPPLGRRAVPATPAGAETPMFPQYAEAYPVVGTPEPTIFKDTGKAGFEKGWTPEMLAFEKERLRIAADMKKHGFTPYFDPALRSDVDPGFYPPNIDTATVVPKKQATIDEHMAVIGSPESRERLQTAYQTGLGLPNTDRWYAMKQLEDKFIDELGPTEGRKAFQERFATSMAATTGGAAPEGNFLMAMYGNYLRKHGLPYPEAAYEMPYPIGGRFALGNMAQHQKIFDAGGFSSLGARNPKRHDFSQAFTGNPDVVTMDEQMTGGMVPGMTIPKWYGLHEQVAREEAAKAAGPGGVAPSPREFQGVGWSGFKHLKKPKQYTGGQPMILTVNESIERTHRLTGMPRDEIVRRGIINGEIPMYGLLGGLGLGAAGGSVSEWD